MIRVFKFGGASIKDVQSIQNAGKILTLYRAQKPVLLVVSAMGKMTNAFEELHKNWFTGKETQSLLNEIVAYHQHIIDELFETKHQVRNESQKIIADIQSFLSALPPPDEEFDRTYDNLIPFGEYFSTCILTHYLQQHGLHAQLINAADYVFADVLWREGRINWDKTADAIRFGLLPLMKASQDQIVVTQGFIARSSEGSLITLGREGSDFSASIFAYCLDAENVTIWKDVPGLFNADPGMFKNVQLIPHVSYHEAVELAYYGQSVIHPKTIKPLQNKNIPLHIRSFVDPTLPGSMIDHSTDHDTDIPCFILKKNQMLVSVSPKDFSFINEQSMGDIIGVLATLRIRMNVMQNSAISFSFCTDLHQYKKEKLFEKLSEKYFVKYNTKLELITIRNYNDQVISALTKRKKIYLEQRSRTTIQLVTGDIQ
jgi:aspartate kinase